MRKPNGALGASLFLLGLLLAGLLPGAAWAQQATGSFMVTNKGKDVGGYVNVYYFPAGQHNSSVASSHSGGQVTIPAGNYDVDLRFSIGNVSKEVWVNGQALSGNFSKSAELNVDIAQAAVTVTNMGKDVGGYVNVYYFPPGQHNSSVASAHSGDQVTIPAGNYDIDLRFNVGNVSKEVWVNGQAIAGNFAKTVELNVGIAQAAVTVTNGGKDVGGGVNVYYFPAGQHDSSVASAHSGDQVTIPPGNYDIDIRYNNGNVSKEVWANSQAISGNFTKTVELNVEIAQAAVTVTNGGKDVGGGANVYYFRAGQHDSSVASGHSDDRVTIPPGNYDIDVRYGNGNVNKEIWVNNQAISGNFTKTVELSVEIAQAAVTVTNGGKDVGGNVSIYYHHAGQHDSSVASSHSGDQVTIPPGNYDIDIIFGIGDASKEVWVNNQAISGNFTKTVELNVDIAQATYTITNGGQDTASASNVVFYKAGNYDSAVSSSHSGALHTVLAGAYDIHVSFGDQLARKELWLYNQQLSGTVTKTIDLGLALAMPTVNVTVDGKPPAGNSSVSFHDGAGDDVGSVAGGQQTLINAGVYDLEASSGGVTGWLRGKNLPAGAETLAIDLSSRPAAAPQASAPPPPTQLVVNHCTVEAYGISFDFDKATLRPEAAGTLQQILALFQKNPGFSGEIGGHTDNIGPRPYNMKLSAARADAVKAWLVAQGVAASRMTTAGYADTRPLVPNDSDANRFKNRRVEIKRNACS